MIDYSVVELLGASTTVNGIVTKQISENPKTLGAVYINDTINNGSVSIVDGDGLVVFKIPSGSQAGSAFDFDFARFAKSITIVVDDGVTGNLTLIIGVASIVRNTVRVR